MKFLSIILAFLIVWSPLVYSSQCEAVDRMADLTTDVCAHTSCPMPVCCCVTEAPADSHPVPAEPTTPSAPDHHQFLRLLTLPSSPLPTLAWENDFEFNDFCLDQQIAHDLADVLARPVLSIWVV